MGRHAKSKPVTGLQDGVLAIHPASRALTSWLAFVFGGALFVGGLAVPSLARAIGVSMLDGILAVSTFLLAVSAAGLAYRWVGGNGRAYRALDYLEGFVGSAAVAFLIYRSDSPFSLLWSLHFVQISLTAAAGLTWMYSVTVLAGPLALVVGFAEAGNAASAWISMLAGSLGFTVFLVLARVYGELEKARLREASLQQSLAAARLERERARISSALHDSVATELTALVWRAREIATSVSAEPAREELEVLAQRLRGAVSELRDVVFALRGTSLDFEDALALLERRCRELSGERTLEFHVHRGEFEQREGLWEDVLPICFELVHNAATHGRGQRVVVDLDLRSRVRLQVADDGTGIAPDAWAGSRGGLLGIRRRVSKLGGTLTLSSNEPGSRVTIELPAPGVVAASALA